MSWKETKKHGFVTRFSRGVQHFFCRMQHFLIRTDNLTVILSEKISLSRYNLTFKEEE